MGEVRALETGTSKVEVAEVELFAGVDMGARFGAGEGCLNVGSRLGRQRIGCRVVRTSGSRCALADEVSEDVSCVGGGLAWGVLHDLFEREDAADADVALRVT